MKLAERQLAELQLRRLPVEVENLLDRLNSPARPVAHLTLVHDVAAVLVEVIEQLCPEATLDRNAVMFGAATHDVGKTASRASLTVRGTSTKRRVGAFWSRRAPS